MKVLWIERFVLISKFIALSGIGWLFDFFTYCVLNSLIKLPSFWCNFISSYVGVTFVWFSSLKHVFKKNEVNYRYLLIYWGYQFLSILIYSKLLGFEIAFIKKNIVSIWVFLPVDVLAKVVITPFNLATNFVFMKILTRKIKPVIIGE